MDNLEPNKYISDIIRSYGVLNKISAICIIIFLILYSCFVEFSYKVPLFIPTIIIFFIIGDHQIKLSRNPIPDIYKYARRSQLSILLTVVSFWFILPFNLYFSFPSNTLDNNNNLIFIFSVFAFLGIASFLNMCSMPISIYMENLATNEVLINNKINKDDVFNNKILSENEYTYSYFFLSPWALIVVSAVFIFGIIILVYFIWGTNYIILIFFQAFTILSLFMYLSVYLPSRFEMKRNVICSFFGLSYVNLGEGRQSTYRLIVYQDGIEYKVMSQSYFIPYSMLEELESKDGMLLNGFIVKSNIPQIPKIIYIYSVISKDKLSIVANTIEKLRNDFIAGNKS